MATSNLRIPGPTPLPPSVQTAMARDMINHRGPEFAAIQAEIIDSLKQFLRTEQDLVILTASGTGGLEAAVVNTLSPGDRVLSVSIGYFGERLRGIAQAYGAAIVPLDIEWGRAADPQQIADALRDNPDVTAVMLTHNETSTGVTNPLRELAAVVKSAGKLLIVDAISSASCIELDTDGWGIDVLVSGSQKGWMAPPGLSFVTMSRAAWDAYRRATMPRYYFDVQRALKSAAEGATPWTPAITVYYALQEGLRILRAEGLDAVLARHQRLADKTRAGVRDLGFSLFADPRHASNTVTAVRTPSGVNADDLRKRIKREYGIVLAGAQGKISGDVFRIGHLGWVDDDDIDTILGALKSELPQAVGR